MLAAVLVSIFAYRAVERGFARTREVGQSIRSSRNIQFDLIDQENSVLGFMSSRDAFFLKTYANAIRQTNVDMNRLDHDAHLLAVTKADYAVDRERDLYREWTTTTSVRIRQSASLRQDRRLQAYSKELLDTMRLYAGVISDEAQTQLFRVAAGVQRTIVVGALSLLASIALLGIIAGAAERARRHQQQLLAREREQELERVSMIAFYDQLTGLQNRRSFMLSFEQILDRAKRTQQGVACLFVDLDGFKAVNDTLGHQAGDYVLQMVAKAMRGLVRKSDIVGRIGGDEFVIVLPMLAKPDDAVAVADKILQVVARPIDIDGRIAGVSASIGISHFPEDGVRAETLLQCADGAMYVAKKGGKNRYALTALQPVANVP